MQVGDLPDAVLFACTQNSVRTPMAEALLKHLLGHRIYVDSVGVRSREVDPFVLEVMDEIGIDLSKHRPKTFDGLEDTSFDLIISLSPEAQHQAVELTRTMACEVEYWPTLDPSLTEGSRVQDTVVTVPVERYWEVEQMIPTGRLHTTASHEQLAEGLRLGDQQFDTCFTGIRADSDGNPDTAADAAWLRDHL